MLPVRLFFCTPSCVLRKKLIVVDASTITWFHPPEARRPPWPDGAWLRVTQASSYTLDRAAWLAIGAPWAFAIGVDDASQLWFMPSATGALRASQPTSGRRSSWVVLSRSRPLRAFNEAQGIQPGLYPLRFEYHPLENAWGLVAALNAWTPLVSHGPSGEVTSQPIHQLRSHTEMGDNEF